MSHPKPIQTTDPHRMAEVGRGLCRSSGPAQAGPTAASELMNFRGRLHTHLREPVLVLTDPPSKKRSFLLCLSVHCLWSCHWPPLRRALFLSAPSPLQVLTNTGNMSLPKLLLVQAEQIQLLHSSYVRDAPVLSPPLWPSTELSPVYPAGVCAGTQS